MLCANLLKGLNMKGKTAAVTVILLLISARTDLLVTPCSASSLMLTISVCSCYLLILHSQHLFTSVDFTICVFNFFKNLYKFLTNRLLCNCSTFIWSLLGSKISSVLDMRSLKKSFLLNNAIMKHLD